MNDVRNLMRTLRGDLEYKEFGAAAAAAAAAGSWRLLKRLEGVADDLHAPTPDRRSTPVAQPEPALATQLRAAAAARSRRGGRHGFSLDGYAASPAAAPSSPSLDDGRHLPLAEVFARLTQGER